MARKQYQSIIRLMEHTGVDPNAPLNIQRLRKQLSAEFDFSATGFIEVGGYSYNKADVFEELDHPLFEQRLAYHLRIWNSAFILSLLENNEFNFTEFRDQLSSFNNDPAFDEFFSPWFSESFSQLSRTLLHENSFQDMGHLLLFEEFIVGQDREEAFRPLRIFLEENLKVFRNLNKENYTAFRPQLEKWLLPYWSDVFNNLPDEYFHYKHDHAYHLVNLTVAIQRSHPKDCVAISQELTCMKDLSSEMSAIILGNHNAYTHKKESTVNWSWVIWIVIILLRVMSGC